MGPATSCEKRGDVTGKLPKIARRSNDAPVGVDHVADGVKRIERNAHGKNNIQRGRVNGQVKPRGELGKAGDGEIKILEKAEQKKIDGDGNDQQQFLTSRIRGAQHAKACKVADRSRKGHERAEFVVPRAVKNIARGGKPNVSLVFCA